MFSRKPMFRVLVGRIGVMGRMRARSANRVQLRRLRLSLRDLLQNPMTFTTVFMRLVTVGLDGPRTERGRYIRPERSG